MSRRRLMNRLFYFTIEDESMLAEAFADFDDQVFVITYKVGGTDDVFVTTGETREATLPANKISQATPRLLDALEMACSVLDDLRHRTR